LFTKEDFDINLEEMKVTCPAGNVKEIKKEGKSIVKFPKKVCDNCPKKKECTKSKSRRSISINEYEKRLEEQRERQKTDEFKVEYNSRSNGERTIYTMTSRGGRLARFIGEYKVHQQEILVATFTNIQNLMGDLFKREKSCIEGSMS
ncbi:MAG: transposase, partial [Bacillota bacterium]|nr:transposase [Bacillota bacterium]